MHLCDIRSTPTFGRIIGSHASYFARTMRRRPPRSRHGCLPRPRQNPRLGWAIARIRRRASRSPQNASPPSDGNGPRSPVSFKTRPARTIGRSMTGYPRDLVGYADQPPDPCWIGGARLAVISSSAMRRVASAACRTTTRSPNALDRPFRAGPTAGRARSRCESTYEYGSRAGFWRLMRVFAERQVIPTIYAVGMALERQPASRRETMARQSCDVVDHGWRCLGYRHRRSNRARAYPPLRRRHSATDRNAADRLLHRHAERQYTAPGR